MIWWLLLSCGVQECEDTPTFQDWTEGFFLSRCMPCHAQDTHEQFGAPYIDLTSHQVALDNLDSLHRTIVETERMPPSGGLTTEEKELIENWLSCPQ